MALAMLDVAAEEGITAIATTPHFVPGADDARTLDLHAERLASLGEHSVRFKLSREVRVNSSLLERGSYRDLTYNGEGKYILLELATQEAPGYLDRLLFSLRLDNITPIIAHPERNMALLREPRKIVELVRSGAHMQLTTSSISGNLGPTIQRFSQAMLEHRLVSFVASDAHNLTSRPFTDWRPALSTMTEIGLDSGDIDRISSRNPQAVFDSVDLPHVEVDAALEQAFLRSASAPISLGQKKRKRFFFF
jgi:protein-tyrosine phosphatase